MIHYLPEHIGYILHERAQSYQGGGAGFLSIKSFSHGQAYYSVGRRRYAVDRSSYLILNHGQRYDIYIEADQQVESCCFFFAPGFLESVQHSLTTTADRLLVEPQPSAIAPITFFERLHTHDAFVSPVLERMRQVCAHSSPEQSWLIEQFYQVMQQLLHVHSRVTHEVEAVAALRAATRQELYRRLHYARDYAAALFATPITIEDMASVAGLSPNHLLRTFKQLFHQTPYQYISGRRIEYAQELLRTTEQHVTEISFAVGFESLGTFSWWFRQRVGVSPLAYRRLHR